jgi:hypothetical protein
MSKAPPSPSWSREFDEAGGQRRVSELRSLWLAKEQEAAREEAIRVSQRSPRKKGRVRATRPGASSRRHLRATSSEGQLDPAGSGRDVPLVSAKDVRAAANVLQSHPQSQSQQQQQQQQRRAPQTRTRRVIVRSASAESSRSRRPAESSPSRERRRNRRERSRERPLSPSPQRPVAERITSPPNDSGDDKSHPGVDPSSTQVKPGSGSGSRPGSSGRKQRPVAVRSTSSSDLMGLDGGVPRGLGGDRGRDAKFPHSPPQTPPAGDVSNPLVESFANLPREEPRYPLGVADRPTEPPSEEPRVQSPLRGQVRVRREGEYGRTMKRGLEHIKRAVGLDGSGQWEDAIAEYLTGTNHMQRALDSDAPYIDEEAKKVDAKLCVSYLNRVRRLRQKVSRRTSSEGAVEQDDKPRRRTTGSRAEASSSPGEQARSSEPPSRRTKAEGRPLSPPTEVKLPDEAPNDDSTSIAALLSPKLSRQNSYSFHDVDAELSQLVCGVFCVCLVSFVFLTYLSEGWSQVDVECGDVHTSWCETIVQCGCCCRISSYLVNLAGQGARCARQARCRTSICERLQTQITSGATTGPDCAYHSDALRFAATSRPPKSVRLGAILAFDSASCLLLGESANSTKLFKGDPVDAFSSCPGCRLVQSGRDSGLDKIHP